MVDLLEAIDAFDRVVAKAGDTAPKAAVDEAATVAQRARSRRGYLGSTVVVALAGGTGSGKSSMVNALAGEEVARTGALRPTTSQPLAWVPMNPEPGVIRLLEDIGVSERVGQDVYDWLVVIDLPDTDSVAIEHRQTVARLLPEVDAVVWVLDPEKYQDRVLHAEHIAPLASYADQFLFVLNQVDRLAEGQVGALVEDLRRTLKADGIPDPVIVTTAADPGAGPPEGIDDLVRAIRDLGGTKEVVHRKVLSDLELAARRLATASGVEGGRGTGFGADWENLLSEVSQRVIDDVVGPPVIAEAARVGRSQHRAAMSMGRRRVSPAVVQLSERVAGGPGAMAAVRRLDSFVAELAGRVEGDTAAGVRQVGAEIDAAVAAAVDTVAYGETITLPPPPDWTGALAWLRRVAACMLVLGGLWLFDTLRSGGELLAPAGLSIAALLLVVVPGAAGAAIGGRRAAAMVVDQREALARAVARELDRRLGRQLRDVLRKRAGLAAAMAEFELLVG